MDDRRRGILLAFAGMLAISTDSLFTRLADADGFDVVFWVGVFSAATMFTSLLVFQRQSPIAQARRGGRPLFVVAVLQAASTLFFVLAVKHTSIANVLVIVAAAPLITAVISRIAINEHTPSHVWVAIAVAACGIVLVIGGSLGGGRLTGDLYAVTAILTFASGTVFLRDRPEVSRTMVIGLGGVIMACIALVPATLFGHSLETWLAIAGMGVVFGPIARVMLGSASRYLPAAEVVLFAPVETVFGTLWAYLVFGESPAVWTWVGGAIILAALLWGVWPRAPRVAAVT